MSKRGPFVTQAVVLAAGNGDRFLYGSGHSKLLTPVAGVPLLIRTLNSAYEAGIRKVHLVVGYDAESVCNVATLFAPADLVLQFHHNPDWHQENGVSVLRARAGVGSRPFALTMGDHIFEPAVLRSLLELPAPSNEVLLAIDRHTTDPGTVEEATRVQLRGDAVIAIGKRLDPYDALDTGLFICSTPIFDALETARTHGDTALSGGIRLLAMRGHVRGVDIGRATWCDVDTVADLHGAERTLETVRRVRLQSDLTSLAGTDE